MWEINSSLQLLGFARSLGLGLVLCLAYDILRALRSAFNFSSVSIFFQDIIFSLFSSITTFTFLLSVTNGEIRGFVLLGMIFGFLITRATVSIFWFRFLIFIFTRLKRLSGTVTNWFYSRFDFLTLNIKKILQKSIKTLKKVLKKQGNLLYTKEDINV